jgi:hypothetical protein
MSGRYAIIHPEYRFFILTFFAVCIKCTAAALLCLRLSNCDSLVCFSGWMPGLSHANKNRTCVI